MSKLQTITNLLGRMAVIRDRWPDSKEELLPIIDEALTLKLVTVGRDDIEEEGGSEQVYDDAFKRLHYSLSEEHRYLKLPEGFSFPNEHAVSMILSRAAIHDLSQSINALTWLLDLRRKSALACDISAVLRYNSQIEVLLGL